jgi:2-(1,2-epoxy-1,2-dihydrophenyl)acetyl-CoA isomerase
MGIMTDNSTSTAEAPAAEQEPPVVTERDGQTLIIRLNRPHALNAFEDSFLLELGLAFREAQADDEVAAVILTGAGRGFCSGADLRVGFDPKTRPMGIQRRLNPVVLAMHALDKPLICAVNGTAAGAGLGFMGVCDVRLCVPQAKFVPAVIGIGIVPDAGVSYFLPRLIGPGRTFSWLGTGAKIDAQTALAWGLVDELVESDALMGRALELASTLAGQPADALRLMKRLVQDTPRLSLAEQLDREQRYQDMTARGRANRQQDASR